MYSPLTSGHDSDCHPGCFLVEISPNSVPQTLPSLSIHADQLSIWQVLRSTIWGPRERFRVHGAWTDDRKLTSFLQRQGAGNLSTGWIPLINGLYWHISKEVRFGQRGSRVILAWVLIGFKPQDEVSVLWTEVWLLSHQSNRTRRVSWSHLLTCISSGRHNHFYLMLFLSFYWNTFFYSLMYHFVPLDFSMLSNKLPENSSMVTTFLISFTKSSACSLGQDVTFVPYFYLVFILPLQTPNTQSWTFPFLLEVFLIF